MHENDGIGADHLGAGGHGTSMIAVGGATDGHASGDTTDVFRMNLADVDFAVQFPLGFLK